MLVYHFKIQYINHVSTATARTLKPHSSLFFSSKNLAVTPSLKDKTLPFIQDQNQLTTLAAQQAVSLFLLWANMMPVNTSERETRQAPGSLGNCYFPGTGISLRTAFKVLRAKFSASKETRKGVKTQHQRAAIKMIFRTDLRNSPQGV